MKMIFWELYRKNLIKKHQKKINTIMNDATEKLEALVQRQTVPLAVHVDRLAARNLYG